MFMQSNPFTIRRLSLTALIGPVLVAVLSAVAFYLYNSHKPFPAFFAVCGACWGLTSGLMKQSLYAVLTGLNLGAILGYSFFVIADGYNLSIVTGIGLGTGYGALLGGALHLNRWDLQRSFTAGAAAGAASFLVLCGVFVLQWPLIASLLDGDLLANCPWVVLPLASIFPLMIGLSFFFWLLVDVLPGPDANMHEARAV